MELISTTLCWQEKQRKFHRENVKNNEIHIHWDFINNPIIYYSVGTQGMWGSLQKFAFLVSNVVYRDRNGELIETTNCYFIKDPKHDWNTALIGVERDIDFWKKKLSEEGQDLETVYNWSDRGEFCCSAFLQGLSKVSEKYGVNIRWEFGQSEHGKNKPDGEGHVIKTALRENIKEGTLKYTQDEEYVITARKFCIQHFNKSHHKMHRNFFAVLEPIIHKSSNDVVRTLYGIMSFIHGILSIFNETYYNSYL